MFDFLFQKKNKEMQSMAEIIALDLEKLNLSKLAIEKAVMMIARAIAKSDIIVQTDSKQKSSIEYRLNVMPNDHECGTYFWTRIIRELLWAQEALIIPMNGKYYKASAWQVSNSVLSERIYGNITLECAGEQYGLYKKFMSSEVIHLRYDNAKIRVYLESVVNQYNNTLNAINYMIRLSNQPKFKLKLGTAQSFREKQADGTDKIVTKDMYAEKIKRLLESEDITVMTESEGRYMMTKQELSEMLHATGCPVNEGISDLDNGKKFPRIDYWEIAWDDVMASGDNYEDKITWQVSFYSRTPRNEKLIMLRDMMRKKGLHPTILHEFITDDKIWHSYFSLETMNE